MRHNWDKSRVRKWGFKVIKLYRKPHNALKPTWLDNCPPKGRKRLRTSGNRQESNPTCSEWMRSQKETMQTHRKRLGRLWYQPLVWMSAPPRTPSDHPPPMSTPPPPTVFKQRTKGNSLLFLGIIKLYFFPEGEGEMPPPLFYGKQLGLKKFQKKFFWFFWSNLDFFWDFVIFIIEATSINIIRN